MFKTSILTIFLLCFYYLSNVFAQPPNSSTDTLSLQTDTLTACYLLEEEKNLSSKSAYQDALDALEEARRLYAKHHQWERAIQCLIQLAILADNFENIDVKVKYGGLSLKMAKQHLSSEHLLLASAFRQKAEALMSIGQLDSSIYFLNQAASLFRKHQDWDNLGWTEMLWGLNHLHLYQLDSCQQHFKNVQKLLRKKNLSEKAGNDIEVTLFTLLGHLYDLQGDYDRAIQNAQQAFDLSLKDREGNSKIISIHHNNLGAYYHLKGDSQRAFDQFTQALNSDEKASEDPVLLINLAGLSLRQRKTKKAIDYYRKSWELTEKKPLKIKVQMDALNGLGNSYNHLGLYDSAMYYCQQAIELPTKYRKPFVWNIMGGILTSQNAPQKALEYLEMAEKTYQQDATAGSHSPFALSRTYRSMGDAHFLNQDFTTALRFYQKALIVNHVNFTDSLNIEANPLVKGVYDPKHFFKAMKGKAKTLASFSNESKELKAALATYQVLIQWTDRLQASHRIESASLDWSEDFKKVYEEAISVVFRLYQQNQNSDYLDLAFSFSEKSKNSLLLESIKANEGKSVVGVPDSLLQKEKDLNIDIAFYEKSLQKAQDQKEEAKTKLYQSYLSQSRLQLVALREKLERDFPKFHALKYEGKTTSITALQSKLLDKQSAFVEYFVGDSSAFIFVITQSSADFLQLKNPSKLQKEAANFREVLLNPKAFQQDAKTAFTDYQSKASILYQSVLQPVLAGFSNDIQRLILVPDEFLNAIPFETLTTINEAIADFDFAKLPYVLYDYSIQYAYSADLLLQNQAKQSQIPSNANCLAFAPSYQEAGQIAAAQRGSLQQLRNASGNLEGTAREIQAIAQFFDGQFDVGKTATEKQFKQFAPQFGILHLAMHGVPDFDNANFNHLQFSNLKIDTLEDNLLHHYEIANMDLQAQLVVLSACETGVGKYEKGEGVYSLARSFMYAGVPSVVMSLWKVSDQSTSELMPYLYENLSDGQSKERALQGAKLRFLKETDLEYRHPFYWSAFVMMGDGTAIDGEKGNWIWWSIVGLVLVGIGGFWGSRRLRLKADQ